MEEREKVKANINARVDAIGWTGLSNAFGGKADYIDMLPFPDIVREKTEQKDNKLSVSTIQCVKRLYAIDKIPRHVVTALAGVAPEIGKILD